MASGVIVFTSLVAFAATASPYEAATFSARRALSEILSSPELERVEATLPVGSGDSAYHFVEARWQGVQMGPGDDADTQRLIQRFTIGYAHNFVVGGPPCDVPATIVSVWPLKEPSKVATTVSVGTPSCKR